MPEFARVNDLLTWIDNEVAQLNRNMPWPNEAAKKKFFANLKSAIAELCHHRITGEDSPTIVLVDISQKLVTYIRENMQMDIAVFENQLLGLCNTIEGAGAQESHCVPTHLNPNYILATMRMVLSEHNIIIPQQAIHEIWVKSYHPAPPFTPSADPTTESGLALINDVSARLGADSECDAVWFRNAMLELYFRLARTQVTDSFGARPNPAERKRAFGRRMAADFINFVARCFSDSAVARMQEARTRWKNSMGPRVLNAAASREFVNEDFQNAFSICHGVSIPSHENCSLVDIVDLAMSCYSFRQSVDRLVNLTTNEDWTFLEGRHEPPGDDEDIVAWLATIFRKEMDDMADKEYKFHFCYAVGTPGKVSPGMLWILLEDFPALVHRLAPCRIVLALDTLKDVCGREIAVVMQPIVDFWLEDFMQSRTTPQESLPQGQTIKDFMDDLAAKST